MTIKINKQDAKWLKLATCKDKDRGGIFYVNVCDSKFGHVAVATDGHRLHLLEVDASIPNGLYMPYATGELRPAQEDKYPDWEYIVAVGAYRFPCDHLSKCEVIKTGEFENYNAYAFGKLTVSVNLLDEAVSQGKAYRIDAQDKPTKPVKVTFLGDRTQFAIVMPCRPRN